MRTEVAVFVPTVLGVGLLFSLVAVLRDGAHRARGTYWLDRRAAVDGAATAASVRTGSDEPTLRPTGRRSQGTYVVVGIAAWVLAVYVAIGSWGNYIGFTGWVETIAWIWLGYLAFVVAFAALGSACLATAVWWERPPAWVRPVLARTVLGSVPAVRRPHPTAHPLHRSGAPRRLGPDDIDDRTAAWCRELASVWGVAGVVILSLLAYQDRMPTPPDPFVIEPGVARPLQLAVLAVIGLAGLLTYVSERVGAAVIAAGAAGLAVFAAVQYPVWVAVAVAVVLGGPAFLHWLAWQRHQHVRHLVSLAVATALLVSGVAAAAVGLNERLLGPAHPPSSLGPLPPSALAWAWAGGTTNDGTTIVARTVDEQVALELVLQDDAGRELRALTPQTSGGAVARVARFTVTGLEPDRRYRYTFRVDGQADDGRAGTFRTMPEGAASFRVAISSCARGESDGSVFDAIRATDPLLYLNLGDIHYANITGDDIDAFAAAYDSTVAAPAQSRLYRSTSTAYVWDDHDYGGNDADRTSPSRPAAHAAYRSVVPHHDLVGDGEVPIAQTFTAGRVRFIVTDARTERTPAAEPDGPAKTMLGAAQKAWLLDQLRQAAATDELVVWANATPWIDAAGPGRETWGGYATERHELAAAIRDLGLADRLVMVSGDAHMLGYDDGTNSAHAGPGSGFPVLQAGSLDRPGGVKGGPYSGGTFPGAGQWGELAIDDHGGAITVTVTGRRWDGSSAFEERITVGR